MKYVVKSPAEGYNGMSAGVVFKNGSGETDDPRIAEWLKNKGYSVSEEAPKSEKTMGPIKKKEGSNKDA